MRANIPPKPIQPNLQPRRPRPGHLKHPIRNPQPRIRRNNLDTRHPLRDLAPFGRSERSTVRAVLSVEGGELLARAVG